MGDSRIKDVSSLLAAFFDEDKLRQGGRYAQFFGSWKEIAGERLAAHSHVADVEKGILIVEAEHPGWIQLLQLRQAEILEATSRRFPDLGLRGIVFRLGSGAPGGGGTTPSAGNDTKQRLGPFGPGGKRTEYHEDTGEPAVSASAPSLENIADLGLRQLLQDLKKTVDGEE